MVLFRQELRETIMREEKVSGRKPFPNRELVTATAKAMVLNKQKTWDYDYNVDLHDLSYGRYFILHYGSYGP